MATGDVVLSATACVVFSDQVKAFDGPIPVPPPFDVDDTVQATVIRRSNDTVVTAVNGSDRLHAVEVTLMKETAGALSPLVASAFDVTKTYTIECVEGAISPPVGATVTVAGTQITSDATVFGIRKPGDLPGGDPASIQTTAFRPTSTSAVTAPNGADRFFTAKVEVSKPSTGEVLVDTVFDAALNYTLVFTEE